MDARKVPVRVRVGAETVARRRKGEGNPVGENPRVEKSTREPGKHGGAGEGIVATFARGTGKRVRSRQPARRVGRNAAKAPKR